MCLSHEGFSKEGLWRTSWSVCALTETMSSGLSLGSSGLGASAGNVSTRALRASMGMEALWGEGKKNKLDNSYYKNLRNNIKRGKKSRGPNQLYATHLVSFRFSSIFSSCSFSCYFLVSGRECTGFNFLQGATDKYSIFFLSLRSKMTGVQQILNSNSEKKWVVWFLQIPDEL